MKTTTTQTLRKVTRNLAALLAMAVAPAAFAANGTWNNTPVSGEWTNVLNWHGGVVPGAINNTANNGTDSASIAFFTNAITTFGGAANPVTPDDATVVNGKARMMGRVVFDGANCGAYVFSSPSPYAAQTASTPETGVMSLCVPAPVSQNATNGSYITAGVTNPQTFLVPVQIRLPSSTTGHYGFTNNATSPNATFYFQRLFLYPGATGRGVNYIFTGSNTGTNTVAQLQQSAAQTGSPSSIRKNGTGRWILSGANTFNGASAVNIDDGTLEVLDPAAFGSVGTTASVNSNGVLQINGVTLNVTSLGLRNSGMVRMNGTAGINGISVNNGVGNTPILATTSASDVFTVGTGLAAASIVAGGAADSVLNTTGPGTLVFGQNGAFANTYVGRWVFGAATNQINGASALGTGVNANVNAGAVFDLTPLGAVAFVPTTSGFGGSGTGTAIGSSAATVIADPLGSLDLTSKAVNLSFNPLSFSGDLTRPALYVAQGGLTLGGNTFFINNTSGTPLGAGTYRLIQSATAITSGGGYAALISGSGMVGGGAAAIQVSGGNVDLVISIYVPKNLVWSGSDSVWDLATTSAWLDGVTASVFNNSDNVTFNSVGAANPNVSLAGTLAPASMVVDTSANDYTLSGGQIAGTTSLKKINAGVLNLQMANTYAGGTVVSNGTLRVGVNEAISSTGAGDVEVYGAGVIDLNGFNNTVNGLLGNGTVDNQSGGASVLTVGNNDETATFSGLLQNTSGTLGLTKIGTGQLTLPGAHTYSGPTTINGGTLLVQNANALGSGTSAVAINSGNLRTTTSLNVTTLTGADGTTIANSAGAGANTIVHTGAGSYTGVISDGTSGTLGLYIQSGTLRLSGNNSYSGGTIVASGATLEIGVRNPGGSGNAGAGGIIASNNTVVSMPTAVSTAAAPGNSITNIDAAGNVTLISASLGNFFGGNFVGGANATNVYVGPGSYGGTGGGAGNMTFANFLGTVVISNGASWRLASGPGVDVGGMNTTFEVHGNLFHRDPRVAHLGALTGDGSLGGPTTGPGTFIIGSKGLSTTFTGIITGNNNITKAGAGSLTLNGVRYGTNIVTLPDTSVMEYTLFTNAVDYIGSTTVSNGTLTIVAPNNLTNSPSVTLAGGTLNVSGSGYSTNQTTLDISATEQPTNTVVVVTGTLDTLSGQSLNGTGNITGNVVAHAGSTVNVGLGIGTLAVSGSVSLNGTVNMDLNRSNLAQNSDRITAASFSGSGAVLNVANAGPTLVSGTVFQLFNGAVSAFTTVNLPTTDVTGQIAYTWQNDLAANGSITLVTGLNPTPTPITSVVNGSNLELSWPLDHTGWTLQAQTNALTVGITANWFNVGGSTATNQMFMPIVPGNPTVFYRLTLPLP